MARTRWVFTAGTVTWTRTLPATRKKHALTRRGKCRRREGHHKQHCQKQKRNKRIRGHRRLAAICRPGLENSHFILPRAPVHERKDRPRMWQSHRAIMALSGFNDDAIMAAESERCVMSRFGETPNGVTLRFVSGASGARATLIAIGWNLGKARLARDAQAGHAFFCWDGNFLVQVPFTCWELLFVGNERL